MAKYLFIYHGGRAPNSPEEGAKAMQAWGTWFETMGSAVIDGGNPIGPSTTVRSNGTIQQGGGSNPVTGYSLVESSSLEAALEMARGCPILTSGGSIEVGETFNP